MKASVVLASLFLGWPEAKTRLTRVFCSSAPSFGLVELDSRAVADAVAVWRGLPLMHLDFDSFGHDGFYLLLDRLRPRFFDAESFADLAPFLLLPRGPFFIFIKK